MDDNGDDDLGWLSSTSGDDGLSWLWDLGGDTSFIPPEYAVQDLGAQMPTSGPLVDPNHPFSSGWQTSGSDRVYLYDDGSGVGYATETDGSYGLTSDQVRDMLANGQLNTFESGYNTATGGTAVAPGGGTRFTDANGRTAYRMPDGRVINETAGGVLTPPRQPSAAQGGSNQGATSKNGMDLKALLPWLLMLMAMKDKGGSSSNQATIPQLSATRNQTPYSQQFPPGRRPGSSAIQYFQDPQTVKYAAQGGIMGLAAGGAVPGFASGGDIDYSAYLAANPDVAAAVASGAMTAADHYNNFGRYEGRDLGGGTSGAQQNYWDSNEWGGTRASGIQSTGTPTFAGSLPNNASFYVAPASFEGNDFNVNLTATDWANVQRNMANGMSYNEAVIRASGDGLGSARIIHDSESGYLPYGVDVITGRPTTANASYSQTVNGGLSSGMYGGVTAPDGTVSFPGGPVTGGSGNSGTVPGTIPGAVTSALVKQTPYTQITQKPGYRPGQGGIQYFEPVKYAAAGGIMGNAPSLGRYAAGGIGRLVAGPGDGVSDDVPASIEGEQPAMIARGEYVIPARVVAELGNGSTEAGAERLDRMVAQIEAAGRKAGRGEDSGAHKVLPV